METETWWEKKWLELAAAQAGPAFRSRRQKSREAVFEFFEVESGKIKGKIAGGRGSCFVKIAVPVISSGVWREAAREMSASAIWESKLAAGLLPENIEAVFTKAGAALFPKTDEAAGYCSVHGEGAGCAHVTSLHLRFASEFDRDPFLIFRLRGMEKETLLGLLKIRPEAADPAAPKGSGDRPEPPKDSGKSGAAGFWRSPSDPRTARRKFSEALAAAPAAKLAPSGILVKGRDLSFWLEEAKEAARRKAADCLAGHFPSGAE